ncbi:MAG: 50S ribosomal protein L30 [Candidatus Aenigmarchaeota archaeon]|nr:50S ribosomal protein L30 [Candidatus Aenigmarchaeota archaeon]
MLCVIRLRGSVKIKREIKDTLRMLRLYRKNTCTLINETPQNVGMIKKVKDYVTWGTISEDMLTKLIKKRGRTLGNKRLDEKFLKENKLKNFEELSKKILEGKIKLKESPIKPYFRLSPPSKGFKGSIKQHYPKGALGNRGDKINDLLKRMI